MACHSQFVHSQYYFASERFNLESVYLRVKNMFLFQHRCDGGRFIIDPPGTAILNKVFMQKFVKFIK